MIVEGRNAVEELVKSNGGVEKILIAKGAGNEALISLIKSSGIQYQFVAREGLDRIAQSKNHQGFIAYVSDYKYQDIKSVIKNASLVLLLDGVEDPHNLGNIIRTAECMGVDAIVIPKNRAATVNETVIKVSAGAASHMKICKVTNINQTIDFLKENEFWVYACELGGNNVARENLKGKVAIVMGGEHKGVSHLTKKLCDRIVSIPMHGRVNSLNVANATAMILYEVQRQRGNK